MTAAAEPVLAVEDLSSGYGDLIAIRGISYEVRPGEVVAMFGANGAGKTTTLLATVGELPRSTGMVRWRGQKASSSLYKLARSGLAFVPEAPSVISGLSTLDNLRIGRGSADTALGYFPELEPLLHRRAGLLSGGEQQILAMARALAGRPDVLLVDELSLGLAPLIVDRLLSALRTIADSTGVGVVLVEQQARRALAIADTWYLLRNGVIAGKGDTSSDVNLDAAYLGSMTGGHARSAVPPGPSVTSHRTHTLWEE
jgi:branched-chain amino acid transport system ATP-binding protein